MEKELNIKLACLEETEADIVEMNHWERNMWLVKKIYHSKSKESHEKSFVKAAAFNTQNNTLLLLQPYG